MDGVQINVIDIPSMHLKCLTTDSGRFKPNFIFLGQRRGRITLSNEISQTITTLSAPLLSEAGKVSKPRFQGEALLRSLCLQCRRLVVWNLDQSHQ